MWLFEIMNDEASRGYTIAVVFCDRKIIHGNWARQTSGPYRPDGDIWPFRGGNNVSWFEIFSSCPGTVALQEAMFWRAGNRPAVACKLNQPIRRALKNFRYGFCFDFPARLIPGKNHVTRDYILDYLCSLCSVN